MSNTGNSSISSNLAYYDQGLCRHYLQRRPRCNPDDRAGSVGSSSDARWGEVGLVGSAASWCARCRPWHWLPWLRAGGLPDGPGLPLRPAAWGRRQGSRANDARRGGRRTWEAGPQDHAARSLVRANTTSRTQLSQQKQSTQTGVCGLPGNIPRERESQLV